MGPAPDHRDRAFHPLLSIYIMYLRAEVVEADQHVGAAALGGDVQGAHQDVQLGPQGVAQPEDRQLLLLLLGCVCGWVEDPYIYTYLQTCQKILRGYDGRADDSDTAPSNRQSNPTRTRTHAPRR